ncbi:MAG: deoxyribodipyrimidine photo-lyase, partial [Lutimonas sp.]
MQKTKEKIALVWFRNDLRIQDQSSLHSAIENGQKVIALYCLDPRHFKISPFGFLKTNVFRSKFLLETLANLKENLNKLNISLLVYQCKPEKIIPILQNKFDLTHIYFQKEWTTEEMRVEDGVRESIEDKEVVLVPAFDQFLIHPDELIMGIEQIPDVFTDFRKNIEKYSKIRPALEIPKNLPKNNLIQTEYDIPRLEDLGFEPPLSSPKTAFPFNGGEKSGLNRINHYFFETGKLGKYKETRNNLI